MSDEISRYSVLSVRKVHPICRPRPAIWPRSDFSCRPLSNEVQAIEFYSRAAQCVLR